MKHHKNKKQKDDWLDWWLSDDQPPPAELESSLHNPYVPPPAETSHVSEPLPPDPGTTNVTLNMQLPKIDKSRLLKTKKHLPSSSFAQLAIFAVFMMLIGLGARSFIFKTPAQPISTSSQQVLGDNTGSSTNPISTSSGPISTDNGQTSNQVPFTPVAPATKPQLANSDFASTTFNSATGIYGYVDNILNNPFNVSEQLIPDNYQNASDALTQLSTSINATQQIRTSNGPAYIYTNPKSGQQTVIFSMKGLLIYINSNTQHTDDVWKAYINTLK